MDIIIYNRRLRWRVCLNTVVPNQWTPRGLRVDARGPAVVFEIKISNTKPTSRARNEQKKKGSTRFIKFENQRDKNKFKNEIIYSVAIAALYYVKTVKYVLSNVSAFILHFFFRHFYVVYKNMCSKSNPRI